MKRFLLKILPIFLISIFVIGIFADAAFAQGAAAPSGATPNVIGGISNMFGYDLAGLIAEGVAAIVNWAVVGMGFILALAGWLLNYSINLTLHIRDFVDSTPAIYTTWRALRDMSGIFIIFFLLFAAFQLILGIETGSFRKIIVNVVVVGLLINFSFFITALGIDASNIVSVQIYNAIAPANSLNAAAATSRGQGSLGISDGGLSDIFMNSLKVQSLTPSALKASTANAGNAQFSAPAPTIIILLSGIIAVIIQFTAALSFVAAAGAFIFRFVVLLLLLAFSPIWIAAHAVPQLKTYSKLWEDQFKSMLVFMPVYLLLMYLALTILTSNPNGLFGLANASGQVGNGAWYSGILSLGVNAFLVCFLLNMPLVVAAKMGGVAGDIINTKKLGAEAIWKRFGGASQRLGAASYQGTVGRAASKIATSEGFKDRAATSKISALALKGTRTVAADYNKKLAEQVETKTKFAESLGYNQNKMNAAQATLRTAQQELAKAKASGGQISVDVAKLAVGDAKKEVGGIEKARQYSYAREVGGELDPTTGKRKGGGSSDTLFMYVARKNKAAASKIQMPILEKLLTAQKETVKETQSDITQLMKAIKNNPATGTTPAGTANSAQAAELQELRDDEVKQTAKVNDAAAQIDALKLIK